MLMKINEIIHIVNNGCQVERTPDCKPPDEECKFCDGTGVVRDTASISCSICSGTGKVKPPDPELVLCEWTKGLPQPTEPKTLEDVIDDTYYDNECYEDGWNPKPIAQAIRIHIANIITQCLVWNDSDTHIIADELRKELGIE